MPVRSIPAPSVPVVDVQTGLMDQNWYDFFNLTLGFSKAILLTYGASIATNAGTGDRFVITITNGTAFTITAPANGISGQNIVYTLRNASGGAHGVITWNAIFKLGGAIAAIANGSSKSISFQYNGTNWVENFRSAADVPN